jgi:lipoprotein NlpI
MRTSPLHPAAWGAAVWLTLWSPVYADAPTLVKDARAALAKQDLDKALTLATRAIADDPKNADTHLLRGQIHAVQQRHSEAIRDFDKCIQLDPKSALAYDHRGSEHFKLGHIAESIQDFDKYLAMRPEEVPGHWRRGISYYYARRFEDGKKQFEVYEKIDTNDVENAVWRYLCMARLAGVEKARAEILKIGNDGRIPLMQVYALFSGKARPADVLAAVRADRPSPDELKQRLFYAHLYLGLYYESIGDRTKTLEHISKAVDDYKLGHYMWDVARVRRDILRRDGK